MCVYVHKCVIMSVRCVIVCVGRRGGGRFTNCVFCLDS